MTATDEQIARVKWVMDHWTMTNESCEALAAVLDELTELRAEVERLRELRDSVQQISDSGDCGRCLEDALAKCSEPTLTQGE